MLINSLQTFKNSDLQKPKNTLSSYCTRLSQQITYKIHEKRQENTQKTSQTKPKTTPQTKTKPRKQTTRHLTRTKIFSTQREHYLTGRTHTASTSPTFTITHQH